MSKTAVDAYGRHSTWANGFNLADNLGEFYETLADPNDSGMYVVSLRKPSHDWERMNFSFADREMVRYYPASNKSWPNYGEEQLLKFGPRPRV